MRVLGVDLAWSEGDGFSAPNESGVVAADSDGTIAAAGWTRGIEATIDWIETHSTANTLVMIDAPLVVTNDVGQRLCDKQVGQRYGRWKVSANSINLGSPMLSGQRLRLWSESA